MIGSNGMRRYRTLDIARKVIARTDAEQGDSITSLMLQKLLFFLQGYWLAVFNTPLLEDDFEAWAYGPAVPVVYEAYVKYGKGAIPTSESGPGYLLETEEEEELFEEIYLLYSQYSCTTLMRMILEDMPWSISVIECGGVISQWTMRKYFRTLLD